MGSIVADSVVGPRHESWERNNGDGTGRLSAGPTGDGWWTEGEGKEGDKLNIPLPSSELSSSVPLCQCHPVCTTTLVIVPPAYGHHRPLDRQRLRETHRPSRSLPTWPPADTPSAGRTPAQRRPRSRRGDHSSERAQVKRRGKAVRKAKSCESGGREVGEGC